MPDATKYLGTPPGPSPVIRCKSCGDLHEEKHLCTAKKEIAKIKAAYVEMRWLLEEADRCLGQHMLGINCHGPALSNEWQARRDMALNKSIDD